MNSRLTADPNVQITCSLDEVIGIRSLTINKCSLYRNCTEFRFCECVGDCCVLSVLKLNDYIEDCTQQLLEFEEQRAVNNSAGIASFCV